ncbi:MAG: CapA family protein, partial [Lachnospiraceae bacterium]|nr:CapA family protein [Lachnospiraceae bacterium]
MPDAKKREDELDLDKGKEKRKTSAEEKETSAEEKETSAEKKETSAEKKETSTGKKEDPTGRKKSPAARRKKRKRRAVRRKQTPFEKYFMKISGPIAFLLLIVSTILTGRTVSASRKAANEAAAAQQMQEAAALALETAESSATPTPSSAPTMRPRALPIPENVPEQDVVGFFTNGLASVDGQSVTVLCGGDNLIHEPIYERARTDNGYDFDYLYQNVKSFIESADIATINQEAPLATDLEDPSGYPHFNTPKEVGQDLFDAGFDVINIGNNHMYDIGSQGALVTEQFFQNRGIPVVGFYRSDEDFHNIRIIEKNGIKVAFLSFVEMTNLDPDDPDLGYCVSMEDRELVKEQIEEAREQADIV